MMPAKSHLLWGLKLANEGGDLLGNLKVCYRIIQDFLEESEELFKRNGGILEEHEFMLNLIERMEKHSNYHLTEEEEMRAFRYSETSYMIWALRELFNKDDIVKKEIKNWDNGEDFNWGSSFRNFEFECHTALRFLEAEENVEYIGEEKEPDFLINRELGVECKRLYMFLGLFTNTLKARKQADELGKPTVVIMNLDYLYNEIPDIRRHFSPEEFLLICSRVAEYGLGTTESNLIGIVLEYISEESGSEQSATVIGIRNNNVCQSISSQELGELWGTVSMGVCGDAHLKVYAPSIEVEKRSSIIHSNNSVVKDQMRAFYDTVITEDIDKFTKIPNFSQQFIMQHNN